jgi:glutamate 5-kinase
LTDSRSQHGKLGFDRAARCIACGMSNYSTADIQTIKGAYSEDIPSPLGYEYGIEVVHHNNLVVL